MKHVLKAATPPVIWSALKAIKRPTVYSTWEAASAAAGTYDDDELNDFRLARSNLSRATGFEPDVTSTPLPLLLEAIKGPASVVDYGGAFGDLGRAIVRRYPQTIYTVVETGSVVAKADKGPISFASTPPRSCDIFFTSGTLQCLPTPYDVAALAFETAERYVAFWRNNFSEQEAFMIRRWSLYENGSGPIPGGYNDNSFSCPCRTIQEARLLDMAQDAGFQLTFRSPDNSGTSTPDCYGANLMFSRR